MGISQAKRKGVSVYSSLGSGTIGGGYVLSESGRKTLITLGIVLIICGVLIMCDLLVMKKSIFVIYEGHIEGVQYVPLFIINLKREFNLEYNQIIDIQVSQGSFGSVVKIVTNGGNYGMILKDDGKEGIEYIRQKIKMV